MGLQISREIQDAASKPHVGWKPRIRIGLPMLLVQMPGDIPMNEIDAFYDACADFGRNCAICGFVWGALLVGIAALIVR